MIDELFLNKNKFNHRLRKSIITSLIKEYNFLHHGVLGQSLCGKSIDFLRLGNAKNMNLWVCTHHAMEWITSAIILKFLKEVCENIKNSEQKYGINFKKTLSKKGITIVPCLNPDGVDIFLHGPIAAGNYSKFIQKISNGNTSNWQANARGIDLNHNYDASWKELHELERKNGILYPCNTRYGGNKPLSEPETFALTNFCIKNNFSTAIAFHSQGEEIYWNYGKNTPKQSETIANILAISSDYKVSEPEGLAWGGGFKDWFIEKFSRPAFTIEIGKGKNPLEISSFEKIYNKIKKMLYISMII